MNTDTTGRFTVFFRMSLKYRNSIISMPHSLGFHRFCYNFKGGKACQIWLGLSTSPDWKVTHRWTSYVATDTKACHARMWEAVLQRYISVLRGC